MPIRPILASLSRHRLTVLLLVLQVTLTCAIVCNAAFMVFQRTALLRQPSGVAEDELAMIDSIGLDETENPLARHDADPQLTPHILSLRPPAHAPVPSRLENDMAIVAAAMEGGRQAALAAFAAHGPAPGTFPYG